MCGRYYGTGFEPRGDYPNLLGITPADRNPKLQGLRAECYFMDELACMMPTKAKHKPPTFEEFCNKLFLDLQFNPKTNCRFYNLEYRDKVVGNVKATIAVSEIDLLYERIHARDIQQAIDEEKLTMYHKLTQEYDKMNKEKADMPINMNMNLYEITDEILKAYGFPTRMPGNKPNWIQGIPAVKKVETYNQRAVRVTFIDDTFTKSVCSEDDHFDLDVGITICLLKRFMGTNSDNATREYNKTINYIHAVMEKNEKEKLAANAQKAADKAKKRKIELKKAAKKLKVKEEQIDIQKQAIIRAHQEMEGLE